MIQLIYILICVAMAYVNYQRIIKDKRVYHGINAVIHLACWLGVWLYSHEWILVLMMPFIGRLFFDTMLNLMRGKPLDYVTLTPKSKVDQAEKWLFKDDGLLPKALYLFIIIVLNIIYYERN